MLAAFTTSRAFINSLTLRALAEFPNPSEPADEIEPRQRDVSLSLSVQPEDPFLCVIPDQDQSASNRSRRAVTGPGPRRFNATVPPDTFESRNIARANSDLPAPTSPAMPRNLALVKYEGTSLTPRCPEVVDLQDDRPLLVRHSLFGKGREERATEHSFNQGFFGRVLRVRRANQMTSRSVVMTSASASTSDEEVRD